MDGGPIPSDIVHHYIKYDIGKQGNQAALAWLENNPDEWPHWQRRFGIEVRGVYDGILIWKCPDCNHMWPRFGKGTTQMLHTKAMEIIEKWENK